MRIAVYPGSFDPVTNGHLDLADRGRNHYDRLIIATGSTPIALPDTLPRGRSVLQ